MIPLDSCVCFGLVYSWWHRCSLKIPAGIVLAALGTSYQLGLLDWRIRDVCCFLSCFLPCRIPCGLHLGRVDDDFPAGAGYREQRRRLCITADSPSLLISLLPPLVVLFTICAVDHLHP